MNFDETPASAKNIGGATDFLKTHLRLRLDTAE